MQPLPGVALLCFASRLLGVDHGPSSEPRPFGAREGRGSEPRPPASLPPGRTPSGWPHMRSSSAPQRSVRPRLRREPPWWQACARGPRARRTRRAASVHPVRSRSATHDVTDRWPFPREGTAPLDLRRPPSAFRSDDTRRPIELLQTCLELVVGQEPEVLTGELVEGGPQRDHGSTAPRTRVRPLRTTSHLSEKFREFRVLPRRIRFDGASHGSPTTRRGQIRRLPRDPARDGRHRLRHVHA